MISDNDYNKARAILINAGSETADSSHPAHTQGDGVPENHGIQLLREARDEFIMKDLNEPNLHAEVTEEHYKAIHKAAETMGINMW